MAKQLFYRYTIHLENYQTREIPRIIVPYERRWERSLVTHIKEFQEELHWDKMWTVYDARRRLKRGCRLFVLRPKTHIKGWVWLMNSGWICNGWVARRLRGNHYWEQLICACLNEAVELDFPQVHLDIDIWNKPSLLTMDNLLPKISCEVDVEKVDEEYSDHLR